MSRQIAIACDSRSTLIDYPDNFFELAIVDPPQGNNAAGEVARKSGGRYAKVEWDRERMSRETFEEIWRVSKRQICWCATFYTDYQQITPGTAWITWDKLTTTHRSDVELAWTSWTGPMRKFTFLWNGQMQGRSIANGHLQIGDKSKNEKRRHPSHKPTKLYQWLLREYTQPGDRILDPTLGSGSSMIAALREDREFVGIDQDEKAVRGALEWHAMEASELVMFRTSR